MLRFLRSCSSSLSRLHSGSPDRARRAVASFFDFTVNDLTGQPVPLEKYRGNVCLPLTSTSKLKVAVGVGCTGRECGIFMRACVWRICLHCLMFFCSLTKATYPGLNGLMDRFGSRGFVVLGFPCNQFGLQVTCRRELRNNELIVCRKTAPMTRFCSC